MATDEGRYESRSTQYSGTPLLGHPDNTDSFVCTDAGKAHLRLDTRKIRTLWYASRGVRIY